MESSLHRSLKELRGPATGGRLEVGVDGFRIDAIAGDGTLVEIQSGNLGALVPKLRRLLPDHRVRVVKPVILSRIVVRRAVAEGPDLSRRRGTRRGAMLDVFDDLMSLAALIPEPNLVVEVLGVAVDEVRIPRRRRPGYSVIDRRLVEILDSAIIASPDDLWSLLPPNFPRSEPFSTADLARELGRPRSFGQRVAYSLRRAGAAEVVAKRGNSRIHAARSTVAANA